MTAYPIQLSKIQCPTLRDETLARDRLLDWLAAKAHSRVLLILADAGYGKTTLLADFSRRTRLRTIWYRLDEDDRDWVAFLSHLVAAGREHDPEFGTGDLGAASRAVGWTARSREAVVEAFLRELPAIAAQGVVLILDDFHLVDDSPDVRAIVRELVVHGPSGCRSRSPAAGSRRCRSRGYEHRARWPSSERTTCGSTRARRRDCSPRTYGRDLEPDVLADVTARTEGWAASLQLVMPRSAIDRRRRSGGSFEASTAPTGSCTTTSPRRSSVTCPTIFRAS
jgi:ATP/maltotriose-dependent transcriptional regulator MalT